MRNNEENKWLTWLKKHYCDKIWNDNALTREDIAYIGKELTRMSKEE